MNLNLGQKAIDVLRLARMPLGEARWVIYKALNEKYGFKPVQRKLEELVRRDYMECGVSERLGWLTPKGHAILDAIDAEREGWISGPDDPYIEQGGEA